MLDVRWTRSGPVVTGGLSAGEAAYLDSEWLRFGPHAPALISSPDSTLSFEGRNCVAASRESTVTPEGVLGALIVAAVQEVADVSGPVEVTGSGIVAEGSRLLLGSRLAKRTEIPAAVIETTGAPNTMATALRRLQDLGTLVLAGESLDRPFDVDLYPDVHSRGLRLVGVAPALEETAAEPIDSALHSFLAASLAHGRLGEPLEPRASWYRIVH